MANDPDGIEIEPRPLSRVQQGKYWVPDCVDYQTKFRLPRRIKTRDVFAGWNCHNCKHLQERSSPPIKSCDEKPSPEPSDADPPRSIKRSGR